MERSLNFAAKSREDLNGEPIQCHGISIIFIGLSAGRTEILAIVAALSSKPPGVSEGTDKMFDKYWKV